MNEGYNAEWDKELNRLLKEHTFTNIENCTANLGNRVIWISNFPCACFTPYEEGKVHYRTSRVTICRAKRALDEAMIREFGRIKSQADRDKELFDRIHRHNLEREEILVRIAENRRSIEELTESIRMHPLNTTTYKNKESLQNNTKIRKHTFKHG